MGNQLGDKTSASQRQEPACIGPGLRADTEGHAAREYDRLCALALMKDADPSIPHCSSRPTLSPPCPCEADTAILLAIVALWLATQFTCPVHLSGKNVHSFVGNRVGRSAAPAARPALSWRARSQPGEPGCAQSSTICSFGCLEVFKLKAQFQCSLSSKLSVSAQLSENTAEVCSRTLTQ